MSFLWVVVVMVMVTPMIPVVRRLRLRSHGGQQEQQQRSEKELFHTLRLTSGSEMRDNHVKPKSRSGHTQ